MSFPHASNNKAEYEALLHGMRMAKACGATRLRIFGDSNLVVQQVMNRCDALSDNMAVYRNLYYYLEGTLDGCEVSHLSRSSNEEANTLANIGSQCLPIPVEIYIAFTIIVHFQFIWQSATRSFSKNSLADFMAIHELRKL
jgi:hypothetical protein